MSDKTVRILNVDDRDISRYVHEETLRLEGFDVVSVANGADALAAARHDIDVVVLDVHLPDIDGFEVCRRLKSDPATSSAIVLMTSAAFVTAQHKIDGLEAGADGYLAQPYDTVEFSATLRALLRTRTAERRATSLALELQAALELRDEFIAMVAHELRNPMAAISMALSIIEISHSDEVKAAKYHEVARRQMANLVRMVDDLLDVSRITRGTVDLRKETLDLAALVQNAVDAVRPAIEARGHQLSVSAVPGPLFLNADATRIEQVVVNLLNNAAKYTAPGGSVSVRLDREVKSGMAVLRVRDTGRGIPEHMLEKVFDVFVQVSPAIDRSSGGMGMGLTLVKRLVELHGGSVSAHSEQPGKGSEFVVRLPLTSDQQVRPDTGSIDASSPAFVKRRIVLVEDSEDARVTLEAFLKHLGHEVVTAKDGLEGEVLLLESRPDVALVDVALPGIDGYEIARRVRAHAGGEALYLVALTSYDAPGARAKAEAAGFDLLICKPCDLEELALVLSRSKADARAHGTVTAPPVEPIIKIL